MTTAERLLLAFGIVFFLVAFGLIGAMAIDVGIEPQQIRPGQS